MWQIYPKQACKCQEFDKIWSLGFLTHWLPCPHNHPWQAFPFVPLLMSSPLIKIVIFYTQLLQEEKICPNYYDTQIRVINSMVQNMHKNAQKFEWNTQSKISCHYMWLLHSKNCLPWWCFPKTQNCDLCVCVSKNVVKCDASGKKVMLSCWKCLFE